MLKIIPLGTVFEVEILPKTNKIFVKKDKVKVFLSSKKLEVSKGEMLIVKSKNSHILYYILINTLMKSEQNKVLEYSEQNKKTLLEKE
jgi:hypothetical protein